MLPKSVSPHLTTRRPPHGCDAGSFCRRFSDACKCQPITAQRAPAFREATFLDFWRSRSNTAPSASLLHLPPPSSTAEHREKGNSAEYLRLYFDPDFQLRCHSLPANPTATMRWLSSLLSVSLLAAASLAAKPSTKERFAEFHAKSLSSAPVKLGESTYRSLTSSTRDYTAAVLLTALEARFQCQLCREFQPEWELLARSWTKGDKAGESRLILGTLDFADGRDVFMSVSVACWVHLQLTLANDGASSACKRHPSSFCSLPRPDRMPSHQRSLCDTTLPAGMQAPDGHPNF